MIRTTMMLPEELHQAVKNRAFERGVSIGEIVRLALLAYLYKENEKTV